MQPWHATNYVQAMSADAASGSDATALGAGTLTAARASGTPSRSDDSSTRWLPAPEPLPRHDSSASLQAAHPVREALLGAAWDTLGMARWLSRPDPVLWSNRF